MRDMHGREIEYVRLSITDRCNLRCVYCMPEEGVQSLHHEELLSFEEIVRTLRVMTGLGIRAVRLTGGEPMARRGCLTLAQMIRDIPDISHLAMTTNGILLKGRVREAADAGIDRLNISLDTLDTDTYRRMTRGGDVSDVLAVIREAVDCGLKVHINAVPVRGVNDADLFRIAALARDLPLDVRFIELMPVGYGKVLSPVPTEDVRACIEKAFGPLVPDPAPHGMGPAVYGKPAGFQGSIGFIGAVSHAFCDGCNRIRVTPEGILKLCLNHREGLDLRGLLRGGASDAEIEEAIRQAILRKPGKHGFGEQVEDPEFRRMNQIGG